MPLASRPDTRISLYVPEGRESSSATSGHVKATGKRLKHPNVSDDSIPVEQARIYLVAQYDVCEAIHPRRLKETVASGFRPGRAVTWHLTREAETAAPAGETAACSARTCKGIAGAMSGPCPTAAGGRAGHGGCRSRDTAAARAAARIRVAQSARGHVVLSRCDPGGDRGMVLPAGSLGITPVPAQ